jgi:hypothetical protein
MSVPVERRLLGLSASFLGLSQSSNEAAQGDSVQTPMWQILPALLSAKPAVPAYASHAVPITLDADVLDVLRSGSVVALPVRQQARAARHAQLHILVQTLQLHDDRSIHGELAGYARLTPFVLTASALDVFAYAEIGPKVWQWHVSRAEATEDCRGWI